MSRTKRKARACEREESKLPYGGAIKTRRIKREGRQRRDHVVEGEGEVGQGLKEDKTKRVMTAEVDREG